MNSPDSRQPWPRLAALARRAPVDNREVSAPLGFATRVAALAFSESERRVASLFELLAPRALWVAAALVVASVLVNYSSFGVSTSTDDASQAVDDPVAMLFGQS
jgi:hypothetical protein